MRHIKEGDWVYTFMGETLCRVVVTHYEGEDDHVRFQARDDTNTYCFYTKDAYLTKEEAIDGMLNALLEITECDCGEDAATIEAVKQYQKSLLEYDMNRYKSSQVSRLKSPETILKESLTDTP